jgi:hypothetical protein
MFDASFEQIEDYEYPILLATGPQNELLKPCKDGLFLKNVTIDWISPEGEGSSRDPAKAPDFDMNEDLVDKVMQSREENDDQGRSDDE